MFQGFIPDHILKHIASSHPHPDARNAAVRSLALSAMHRMQRRTMRIAAVPSGQPSRYVFTANGQEIEPGTLVRSESQPPVPDSTVNLAYDDAGVVLEFYQKAFGRNSIDGVGLDINSTVHYGQNYDNAFWQGTRMDYGDGDGVVFRPFVAVIDIPGHEMSHGVTQYTSNLNYQDQSGALNESFSDCMGSCVKQYKLQQMADKADWLIGEGLFFPAVNGRALRDMRNPGTAFDDPQLGGKDPQPANMANYIHTSEDDGGVHLNSGIPNKAFADACVAVGGHSWEKVGLVWYKTNQSVPSSCDFATWAKTTVSIAGGMSSDLAGAIATAWAGVGIPVNGNPPPPPPPPPSPPPDAGTITPAQLGKIIDGTLDVLLRYSTSPQVANIVRQERQFLDANMAGLYAYLQSTGAI